MNQVGTTDWDRERLNMSVNISPSWSAHALKTRDVIINVLLTSATENII